jgi:hypothetical protein
MTKKEEPTKHNSDLMNDLTSADAVTARMTQTSE